MYSFVKDNCNELYSRIDHFCHLNCLRGVLAMSRETFSFFKLFRRQFKE